MSLSVKHRALLAFLAVAFTGCGLVDDDLSDCETEYTLDYQLRLVTNMTTELKTQLSLAADISVSNAIKAYLADVFTDFAHDVDLGFFDVEADSVLLHRESHIMDANQSSYTLYIPVRRYMHLATANLSENQDVTIEGSEHCHSLRLVQALRDTVSSHHTGIFSARLPMDIKEGEDQQFDVSLFMANSATALVVDTLGSGVRDMKVFMTGFATSFNICDSLYHFDYTPVVKADRLTPDAPGSMCFASVTFPSRTEPDSKVIIDIDDPFVSEAAERSLWQIAIYSTLRDGSVTKTLLGVAKPLFPGQLKLLKARAYTNGTVAPGDPSVSVSVTLDWEPGLEIPVDL